jgi:hypothetical protein
MPNPPRESGLLEQPILRVRSTELLDTENQLLGHIYTTPVPGLRGWVLGPAYSVHEAYDQPLVFTLSRVWTPFSRWEVRDAEEAVVGWVTPRRVLDRWDQVLFRLDRDFVLRTPQGWELGVWRDPLLHFATLSNGQPFLRMLMLALILRWRAQTSR